MARPRKKITGKNVKRVLGRVALGVGTLGAALLLRWRKRGATGAGADRWARPGMRVTFRAELMPGRDAAERTYRVRALLPSGRVTLEGVTGEHVKNEFEPVRG